MWLTVVVFICCTWQSEWAVLSISAVTTPRIGQSHIGSSCSCVVFGYLQKFVGAASLRYFRCLFPAIKSPKMQRQGNDMLFSTWWVFVLLTIASCLTSTSVPFLQLLGGQEKVRFITIIKVMAVLDNFPDHPGLFSRGFVDHGDTLYWKLWLGAVKCGRWTRERGQTDQVRE